MHMVYDIYTLRGTGSGAVPIIKPTGISIEKFVKIHTKLDKY